METISVGHHHNASDGEDGGHNLDGWKKMLVREVRMESEGPRKRQRPGNARGVRPREGKVVSPFLFLLGEQQAKADSCLNFCCCLGHLAKLSLAKERKLLAARNGWHGGGQSLRFLGTREGGGHGCSGRLLNGHDKAWQIIPGQPPEMT